MAGLLEITYMKVQMYTSGVGVCPIKLKFNN